MLKGTTKIELTDIHTGEKEVIEKHNLVTNALSNIFQPIFGNYTRYYTMRNWTPGQNELFGGLLLFDTTLTENANTLYAPAGTSLTGSALYGYVNTTSSTKLGSYNVNESSFDSVNRRMTFVYDFTTSQGNGVISSVCLTSRNSGFGSYGTDIKQAVNKLGIDLNSSDRDSTAYDYAYARINLPGYAPNSTVTVGNEYRFLLDVDNDQVYLFKLTDSSNITMVRRNARIKNRSLFNNDFTVINSQELTQLPTAIGTFCNYNYDSATGCLYIISAATNLISNNSTILITKINITNNTVTQYTVTNKTGETLYFNEYSVTDTVNVICHQDYIYLKNNISPYSIYKIDITNSDNKTKLAGTFTEQSLRPYISVDGKIYWQYYRNSLSDSSLYITDSQLNTTKRVGSNLITQQYTDSSGVLNGGITPIKNHKMFYYDGYTDSYMGKIFILGSYLATINNLAQPVTKTADRTMKITYIIEEVSSNT